MRNMGGIANLVDKIPGFDEMPDKAMEMVNDKEVAHMEAVINSMTPHERRIPSVIKGSRKKRIAKGSGTKIQDVNRLLKQFTQMQKMVKQASKKRGMAGIMRNVKGKMRPTPRHRRR